MPAIAAAIVFVLLGRALAVYPLCAIFVYSRLRVATKHQHVLFWGGLRGSLALALALGLPPDIPHANEIIRVTFAVAAFSVFCAGIDDEAATATAGRGAGAVAHAPDRL